MRARRRRARCSTESTTSATRARTDRAGAARSTAGRDRARCGRGTRRSRAAPRSTSSSAASSCLAQLARRFVDALGRFRAPSASSGRRKSRSPAVSMLEVTHSRIGQITGDEPGAEFVGRHDLGGQPLRRVEVALELGLVDAEDRRDVVEAGELAAAPAAVRGLEAGAQDVRHRRVVFGRVQPVHGFRTRVEGRNRAARTRARVSTTAAGAGSGARTTTAGAARERNGEQARRLEAVAAQGASAGGGSDHGCFTSGIFAQMFR